MTKMVSVQWSEDTYYEYEFEVEDDFDETDDNEIENLITNMDREESGAAFDGLIRDIRFDAVVVTDDA